MSLPAKLQEIVDDFASMTREDKLDTLIAYAETFPPLPDWLKDKRDRMEPVPECMTPVFLFGEKQPDGGIHFYFDIPPQSPTVRGLATILANGLNGSTPEEVLSVPADFYQPMNLQEAVSSQRLNGFHGVLAHMKQEAVRLLEKPSE
ncbi:MAG: cysteine desulfuration protein SufE [Anaerolineales bacterium]|nr:SufE family protein [Anaerolineae bacterium]PWB75047.1 MAG: cysteine desulfuration protein SufE [Anaerolineales bacterium]